MNDWTDNHDAFAYVYDQCWATRSCDRFLAILDEHVLGDVVEGAHILDLCCGTGRLDERLCERGFRVRGIDNAPAMIALARRNAPSASFEVADARGFEVGRAYPLVISTYNGLNHIPTAEDLGEVFRREATFEGTLFVEDDGELWTRRDFVLRQRSYRRESVCDLLTEAGFEAPEVTTLEEDEDGQPLMWLFRARRTQ